MPMDCRDDQLPAGQGEGRTVIRGRVKWFDPARGFGFLVSEHVEGDVLLHANVLRSFGQGALANGTLLSFRMTVTGRGRQVVEIVEIEARPATAFIDGTGLGLDPARLAALPLEPTRIMWFDRRKGFGFAKVFGEADDIFLHAEVLQAAGLHSVEPGEAVALRMIDGKRGRIAVQAVPWDQASRSSQ